MNILQKHLAMAAKEAGTELIAPFTIEIESGRAITVDAYLPELGHEQGMLVANSASAYAGMESRLVSAGYGYTSYAEPGSAEVYDSASYSEMLREWGWNANARSAGRGSIRASGDKEVIQVIGGFPSHQVRGPEVHPSGDPGGDQPHGHVGPVEPILVRND